MPSEAGLAAFNPAQGKGVRSERRRVEAIVETLSNLRAASENLAEVAHDARNMVTALGLYCDLLEEPGVLNPAYQHYGSELRLVATASRRLVEKLVALDAQAGLPAGAAAHRNGLGSSESGAQLAARPGRAHRWDLMPAEPIRDLAAELNSCRNLLSALAGPSIALTVEAEGGALPVRLTGEDSDSDSGEPGQECRRGDARGGQHPACTAGAPARRRKRRGPDAHRRG